MAVSSGYHYGTPGTVIKRRYRQSLQIRFRTSYAASHSASPAAAAAQERMRHSPREADSGQEASTSTGAGYISSSPIQTICQSIAFAISHPGGQARRSINEEGAYRVRPNNSSNLCFFHSKKTSRGFGSPLQLRSSRHSAPHRPVHQLPGREAVKEALDGSVHQKHQCS
jgi:hypothetical protein